MQLKQDSHLEERRKAQLKLELRARIESEFSQILWQDIVAKKNIDIAVEEIWSRGIDPQNAARKIVLELIEELVIKGKKL